MRRPIMIPAVRLWALLAVFLFAATASAQSPLGGQGTISGKVVDQSGKPVPYASVVLVGTQWGGMSVDDGSFTIVNIPAGTYTMKALIIGYTEDQKDGITVIPNQTATVNFSVAETTLGSLNEVEITAQKEKIDIKSTDTSHEIDSKDLESLPVNEISEAIGLKAGVIAKGGELHFRGGRSGEVNIMVDGVAVKDPLLGAGAAPATLAVEATETIMGGLDAEFGNAQSGVINYTTKEGGREFEGQLYYMTDDYGQPDNTYDNLDRVFLGVGGPSPVRNLSYYASVEGTFADAYPATPRDRGRTRILNFISVGDRKSNSVRLQSKLAFKPGPNYKLTGEFIFNNTRSETYYHMWSRVGYVQTFRDTTQTGDVVIRHGRWAPTQVDETYEYYNPANHTPTNIDRFNQMKFVWNHTIDESAFYNIKMGRNFFYSDRRVSDKNAWEYLGERERDLWYDYFERETEPFFVISGDYPTLSHRETIVYTVKSDFTKKYKNHTIKTGVEASYNDMKYFQVDRPYNTNAAQEIGGTRTRYHYFNPEGAYYLQDRWEHEGMVLNVGLRYDVFSVGEQLSIVNVDDPVKQQISPRVGIAYPISDRDAFSFHYGRFYQIPDRQYLFDNQDAYDGRVRGNPNLTNETNVAYQAGIQHLFSDNVSGLFSVYYKDIFGLISTDSAVGYGQVSATNQWVNKDYASARGFEATLSRSFANGFGGELNYGFGVATGVASDPNANAVGNLTYKPISEQALDWDVRHTFSVQASFADIGSWNASFIWQYESGFPYTPESRDTRELQPENTNSRRLPSTTSLDIQAQKYYQLWGQQFKVFLQSRNVLDAKNITNLSPGNWPAPPGSIGNDYAIYYTETGQGGGAYVGDDNNGDGIGDWVPLNDPRVFGDPRSIKLGVQLDF